MKHGKEQENIKWFVWKGEIGVVVVVGLELRYSESSCSKQWG